MNEILQCFLYPPVILRISIKSNMSFLIVLCSSSRSMPENLPVALYSFEVIYDSQSPSFAVGKREDRTGTYVTWTRDDLKTLKRGDRSLQRTFSFKY